MSYAQRLAAKPTAATGTKLYGEAAIGCWVDGARGRYIGDEIISIAVEHGWVCDDPIGDRFTRADDERYHDLWADAEDFMQQFAVEGFHFGTSEGWGDWGLYADEEEERRCQTCGVPVGTDLCINCECTRG